MGEQPQARHSPSDNSQAQGNVGCCRLPHMFKPLISPMKSDSLMGQASSPTSRSGGDLNRSMEQTHWKAAAVAGVLHMKHLTRIYRAESQMLQIWGRLQRVESSVFQRLRVTGSPASMLKSTSCLITPGTVVSCRNDDSFQRCITGRSKPAWLRHSKRETRQALLVAVGARCRLRRIAQTGACADPCRRECRRVPAPVRG
jgi:hypothetical protein